MTTPEKPHTYKMQRRMEKDAATNREAMLQEGKVTLPTVCGYTYTPVRPKNPPVGWTGAPCHCTRNAGANTTHNGTGFCDYHDWMAATTIANSKAPAQLKAALRIAEEQARFFGKPINVDPHTALLDEIARTASIVAWLENKLQELREEGYDDKDIIMQYTKQSGFQMSVWIALLSNERDHLVKTCVAAIKAGVAERKVQIAEQQARLIAAMMFAFMHDPELNLTPDQMLAAPKLIRKHLMQLPQQDPNAVDPQLVLSSTTNRTRRGVIDV